MLTQTRLAVSLEGPSIRLLACQGNSVTWWADIQLDPHLLRNGFLIDARGFVQAIKSSEIAAKIRKGAAVAAMPGYQSFSRILRVPKEAQGKLSALVAGEARRSIPDVERNMFVYWQPFGDRNALQQSVFLLAVPRQPLTTYLEALTMAGISAKTLDLHPLALARAVNRQNAIIGNAERMTIDVVIVRNDVPVAMRSLYLGEDFGTLEFVNSRLADELARTVGHYDSTSQDGPLEPDTPVFLTGLGASDPALPAMVEDTIQYPIAKLEPPFKYPDDFPVDQFMVHMGLFLK